MKQYQKGFTLVELLAVIIVFATIGSLIVTIFVVSLRGSKKSDALVTLRQNGNSALSEMVRTLRFAKSLDAPYPCTPYGTEVPTTTLSVTTLDNDQVTYACTTGSSGTISSNSASLLDTSSVSVSDCSFSCKQANAYATPIISVSFTLVQKNASSLVEGNASIPFSTSVSLRNYNQ